LLRDTTNTNDEATDRVSFGRLGRLIGYNLTRGQLKTRLVFDAAVEGTDLRPSQFAVLLLVEATPGIKQTTLADLLSVDRSTMVRIVDRCEEFNLLRRGSSSADRRAAPLQLTAAGKTLINRLFPRIARAEEGASVLTASERRTFLRLLRKFNGLPK
jgi:DNA-binding MarR family transcriptional regulator